MTAGASRRAERSCGVDPALPGVRSPCTPCDIAGGGLQATHAPEGKVRLVRETDNAEGLEPRGDSREWPDHQMLAFKAADAVVEQKGVLPPMHLRKKGAQDINVRLTIETIHGGPPVAWLPLSPHTGRNHDKKREQTLREDHGGRGERVDGHIPYQLVLRLLQPVHEFGVTGSPVVRMHSETFLSGLEMPDLTRPTSRLASARRCTMRAAEGGVRGNTHTETRGAGTPT